MEEAFSGIKYCFDDSRVPAEPYTVSVYLRSVLESVYHFAGRSACKLQIQCNGTASVFSADRQYLSIMGLFFSRIVLQFK